MILAGLERDTGRAVAFGIPRNLVNVQLGGRAGEELRRFLTSSTRSTASRTRSVPTFPGGRDPGATAPQAGDFAPARPARGLLRDGRPGRVPRPRGRARRSENPGARAHRRRSDATSVGRDKATHQRVPGADLPFRRAHCARVRALAQGLGRLQADAPPALLPDCRGEPARRGQRAAQLAPWRRSWNRACGPISRATSFPTSSAS